MPKRWLALSVSGAEIIILDVEISGGGVATVLMDDTWTAQSNEPAGYQIMYQRICDYIRDKKIEKVVIKASAVVPRKPATLALLKSAELRGAVAAAAAASCADVVFQAKANASRTGGDRTVDEYVKDDAFWKSKLTANILRKGSRELAYLLLVEAGR